MLSASTTQALLTTVVCPHHCQVAFCCGCANRVAALVRLEGVVKGGAAGTYEAAFLELLRQLRDPLLEQAVDRR